MESSQFDIKDYHNWVAFTRQYEGWGSYGPDELATLGLGVAGEAGEIANKIKKVVRKVGFHDKKAFHIALQSRNAVSGILEEMGDTLWYIIVLCMFYHMTTEELMIMNTFKLFNRLMADDRYTEETLVWPFQSLSYAEAYKLTQDIESRIIKANVSMSMDTDT